MIRRRLSTLLAASIAFASSLACAESYEIHYVVKGLAKKIEIEKVPLDASDISCGLWHCLALVEGEVWAVGGNSYGQLGTGDKDARLEWVNTGQPATAIEAGYTNSYLLHNDTVWSVGRNHSGQLARAGTTDQITWGNTNHPAEVIEAGAFSVYTLSNGYVWSAGENYDGQLALGDTVDRYVFTNTGRKATAIAVKRMHA